jgi:hypothetical protein
MDSNFFVTLHAFTEQCLGKEQLSKLNMYYLKNANER